MIVKIKNFPKVLPPEPTKIVNFEYMIWTVSLKIFQRRGGSAPPRTPWFIACAFLYFWILLLCVRVQKMLSFGWKMCSFFIEFSNFFATIILSFGYLWAFRTKILRTPMISFCLLISNNLQRSNVPIRVKFSVRIIIWINNFASSLLRLDQIARLWFNLAI